MVSARAIVRPPDDADRARANFDEALAVARAADDPLVSGYVLSHYGLLLAARGQVAAAQSRHQDTLAIARAVDDENLRAEAHYDLAVDATALGHRGSARHHLAAALEGYRGIDHLDGLTRCLGALAAIAVHTGDPRLASRLVGAAAAARDRIGLRPWPSVAVVEGRTSDGIAELLPPAEVAALAGAGRELTIEQALRAGGHLLPQVAVARPR
ncbi:hypothetical protein O7635_25770 [Asanoa sp. WMMD1127]|uniref:hypothetical protein n=1 Tax=Asanoa sp. WMMD1127 TaxID=3016107 RepID=UPI002415E430|nr:hypothetical protein [Asanoa sp. WMMD1127]MDG4825269.1 hypothetical protein [Asanoa sp. WMMD1127]